MVLPDSTPPPPKSGGGSNSKVMLGMAAVNLIAIAIIAGVLLNSRPNTTASAQGPLAIGHARVMGELIELKPLVVNLNVIGASRFLKVSVQLELPPGKTQEDVKGSLVVIRDRLLVELSSLNIEDTQGAEQKLDLQDDLRDKLNELLGPNTISRILFNEFVVQ